MHGPLSQRSYHIWEFVRASPLYGEQWLLLEGVALRKLQRGWCWYCSRVRCDGHDGWHWWMNGWPFIAGRAHPKELVPVPSRAAPGNAAATGRHECMYLHPLMFAQQQEREDERRTIRRMMLFPGPESGFRQKHPPVCNQVNVKCNERNI